MAESAAKIVSGLVVSGLALYTLKFAGEKKVSFINSKTLTAQFSAKNRAENGKVVAHVGAFLGLAYAIKNYGDMLSVA